MGKSLTLNSIGTLFEKGVDLYFKGSWVYDRREQGTLPVRRLNFLKYRVSSVENSRPSLPGQFRLLHCCRDYREQVTSKEPALTMVELLKPLGEQQLVILIDEYDCELTTIINKPEVYRQEMSSSLGGTKHKGLL